MLQDIDQHLHLITQSLAWAQRFDRPDFPGDNLKEYRRQLKRIRYALEENCSAAAYGESQVGKSYLMSSLLSSPQSPFVVRNDDKAYSFIDELNSSGGNNSKVESTGVITRFSINLTPPPSQRCGEIAPAQRGRCDADAHRLLLQRPQTQT